MAKTKKRTKQLNNLINCGTLKEKTSSSGAKYLNGAMRFKFDGKYAVDKKKVEALCEALLSGETVWLSAFKKTREVVIDHKIAEEEYFSLALQDVNPEVE